MKEQLTPSSSESQLISEEINDIISRRPHWLVRSGNIIFLILLAAAVVAAKLIKYPDIIQFPAVLVSTQQPAAANEYYATIILPQSVYSKVGKGQVVLLKFEAYPYQEFGIVRGLLDSVASSPSAEGYLARVNINKDLPTTHGKKLNYKAGLTANAEIVLRNISLLDRLAGYIGSNKKTGTMQTDADKSN